ncbi:hypothetical protein [Pleionea sediminis]|uniref:hypothetical protein n=1 Tax=Pleionea sediminis TaxID=2569479 RepID=UPI001184FA7B|nr:hypothetical protein [Pleionea sediminis]
MKLIAISSSILILISGLVLRTLDENCYERRLTSNGEFTVSLVQCSSHSGEKEGSLELKDRFGDTTTLLSFDGSSDLFQFQFNWNQRRSLTISYTDYKNALNVEDAQKSVLSKQIAVRLIERNYLASQGKKGQSSL